MHSNSGKFLGELEKEIMEVVWQSTQPITVRLVFESISKKRKIAYTTVMTIMGRLAKKGYLKTEASGKAYIYKAVLSKDKFLTKVSRQIIRNLISSFGNTAIAHFAQELEKIPVEKKQKLLRLLKETDGK